MALIPVKFYKLLNPPATPATPNAIYFIQPTPDVPVTILLTDEAGALFPVAATSPVYSGLVLASVVVNLNEGTGAKQTLYTVPANRRAILTRVDIDGLSAIPTNAEFKMGWNGAADDVLVDAFHLADLITATTSAGRITGQDALRVGTTTQALGLAVTTVQGSALTGRINVFGYLTDGNGVPV